MLPIPPELAHSIQTLTPLQMAWLSGYCWAKADGAALPDATNITHAANAALPAPANTAAAATAVAPRKITVLPASQTGNARKVASTLAERLQAQGLAATHASAADYKPKNLAGEEILLLVISTQGEGEPPEEAISLHKFLQGKKAPQLKQLQFAVLGLGDSSYPNFCQAGKDFDARLAELGGTRLAQRQDCDLDFDATATDWQNRITALVQQAAGTGNTGNTGSPANASGTANTSGAPNAITPACAYNKDNPFPATLLARQRITGRGSDKDVRHIELDLTGSGLQYQPGDALGIWFDNDDALVDNILAALHLSGEESTDIKGQRKPLREALLHDLEITQTTPHFAKGYAALAGHAALQAAVEQDVHAFVAANPIAAIVQRYPAALQAQQLVELLRPLTPRLYSIASAQDEVGDEVHLTVGVLRYESDGRAYTGAASGYLAQRLPEDGAVRVFVERNPNFRLPQDPATPIIMIGAGTGIAPFRAFVQQRAAAQASGKNWLIFGNPHFTEDFLYQTEWQTFAKDGYLHRYSFAWSRDQQEKIYVQHKIRENAAQLWQWLQEGAHLYVCGDATRMAKDVEAALLETIATQGGLDEANAHDYLDTLRQDKRYQRDVY